MNKGTQDQVSRQYITFDLVKARILILKINMAEEDFECPVCFFLPEKEVYQCEKGHVLCDKCSASLQQCPQCRVSIAGGTKYRNLFMEQTLDKLRVACEFKDKGCGEKLKRGEVSAHSRSCKFGRTLPICKLLGLECDFKIGRGNLSEIISHFEVSHGRPLKEYQRNRLQMITLTSFYQAFATGFYIRLIEFLEPRNKILFAGHVKDGYVSWLCFDLNEVNTPGLQIEIWSAATPSISWKLPLLRIMDAEKYFKDPPTRIHIPFLDMLRKEKDPRVQDMDYEIIFS